MMIQENMLLIFVLISGKDSCLCTICFLENTFYTNLVYFKDIVTQGIPEVDVSSKPFQLNALKILQ